MKIAFLLPGYSMREIGGYRTVYIYANYLSTHGNEVTILYPHTMAWPYKKVNHFLFNFITYIKKAIFVKHKVTWFSLDSNVKEKYIWNLADWCVGTYDIIIATAILTSRYLNENKQIDDKRKIYYIQGFENWYGTSDDEVFESYKFKMRKIVIAKWLQGRVERVGQQARLIHIGLEHKDFYLEKPANERSSHEIMFYWHEGPFKGCQDTLAALEIIHNLYPDIHVTAFGFFPFPAFPNYITYYKSPSREQLRKLYNNASIFVGASITEGFGLTIGEAMCCGCAVACTDNDGYREMVVDKHNGLLSPIKNPETLAKNIRLLINNPELRLKLSQNAVEDMKQFSWEKSCAEFEEYLMNSL